MSLTWAKAHGISSSTALRLPGFASDLHLCYQMQSIKIGRINFLKVKKKWGRSVPTSHNQTRCYPITRELN